MKLYILTIFCVLIMQASDGPSLAQAQALFAQAEIRSITKSVNKNKKARLDSFEISFKNNQDRVVLFHQARDQEGNSTDEYWALACREGDEAVFTPLTTVQAQTCFRYCSKPQKNEQQTGCVAQ